MAFGWANGRKLRTHQEKYDIMNGGCRSPYTYLRPIRESCVLNSSHTTSRHPFRKVVPHNGETESYLCIFFYL